MQSPSFVGGGRSRIECFLRGERVSFAEPADCHGKPPFWRWWHDYRNCYASNVCLLRGTLTVYGSNASEDHDLQALAVHRSLACVDWISTTRYEVEVRDEPFPTRGVFYHDAPALHSSRILPGHFGHDVLNSLFYAFETFSRANLTAWLRRGARRRPSAWAVEDDLLVAPVLDSFVDHVQYGPRSRAWNERHCFRLAMLGSSHAWDANLVFRRNSPTRLKRRVWREYRDLLLERFACSNTTAEEGCDDVIERVRRPRRRPYPAFCDGTSRSKSAKRKGNRKPRITVLTRSTVRGSSAALTANGRGRRILNSDELTKALGIFGTVVEADPGRMSLREQQLLMIETDVLVSRMGSQVVNAMFMRPGSLCVEVEAPDPAHLYYDHPSTFEEIAEIFGHVFVRSTQQEESAEANDPSTFAMVGDVLECCRECRGPPGMVAFLDKNLARSCCKRCSHANKVGTLARRDSENTDFYLRSKWFMNWWLSNSRANIPEILDLVAQHLRRCPEAGDQKGDDDGDDEKRRANAPRQSYSELGVYRPSPWEREWVEAIGDRESDDLEWLPGCEAMRRDEPKARRWLDWAAAPSGADAPTDVFSSWTRGDFTVGIIEPLVGHLRHPFFHCVGDKRDTFDLMFSKDYLILATARAVRPGASKFFFDAGASNAYDNCWWGCTKWFVDAYRARGIDFDRILLWEATPADPKAYWASVPPDVKPKLQYFNVPLNSAPPDNLWHHLRALAKPDDFVVVKLDIDNYDIEVALVRTLLASPDLLALVDEFFWEHHVNGSPLRRTRVSFLDSHNIGWHHQVPQQSAPDGHLRDSYRFFSQLRAHGIRAHAWV
ncbi:hypothetical protein CTAYLR_002944 [Chrysophaeum taylorii]|uniref:Glycosyltransferase 61 catalytic domain-containing protein n=1 Tax=Chrysophaeum taylorii TaxID=2483200 RepID=A0AAD7UP83_9STRA|nr:hypothetical protein CTAYLR_002944 [Chrysophaeum taylorii]